MTDRKVLKITEAARKVSVSRRTIYNWIADGKVETVRVANGKLRIYEDSLWRRGNVDPPRASTGAEVGMGGATG